jgi:hypothetical protein
MSDHSRRRTDPIASHAYTLPVVREMPSAASSPSAAAEPHDPGQPVVYAADAHAW